MNCIILLCKYKFFTDFPTTLLEYIRNNVQHNTGRHSSHIDYLGVLTVRFFLKALTFFLCVFRYSGNFREAGQAVDDLAEWLWEKVRVIQRFISNLNFAILTNWSFYWGLRWM